MIDWNRLQHYQQVMAPWQWGLVILGVSVAIWLIVLVRSYFREDADDADQTLEMLTQFRELHQEGGLSDDEFRLIRSRLASSAHKANATDSTKQKATPVESVSPESAESKNDTSREVPGRELPAIHATAEKEANSERMTENETD